MDASDIRVGRRVLAGAAAVVLVVSAVAAGASLPAAGAASAAPTPVGECTTIDESGAYELSGNLSVVAGTCLSIEASDVTLDGNGHAVATEGRTSRVAPVVVVGGSDPVTNVTVTNAVLFGEAGVSLRNSTGASVRATRINVSLTAVELADSDDNRIRDNAITEGSVELVDSDGNEVLNNEITSGAVYGVELAESDDNTLRGNLVRGAVKLDDESGSNLVYDNVIDTAGVVDRFSDGAPRRNAWNVSARPGENVVGGGTTGGNYYADRSPYPGDVGFSEACADDDSDGVCDSPNTVALNNTDHLPLAADGNASVPYFEVADLDAPARVTPGEETTVTVRVTNVGTEAATQPVVLLPFYQTSRETVTLAPGETATVTFEVTPDGPGTTLLTAASNGSRLSKSVTVADGEGPGGPDARTYQVDFVAGDPIESLSADRLYAGQDRLFRFAFGNVEDGITERGSAWPSERLRACVDYAHVRSTDGGDTAQVSFTVADGCEPTLSLVVYSLPGETFSVETADQQDLLNSTTETYGPGEHTIAVDLPDEGDGGGDD